MKILTPKPLFCRRRREESGELPFSGLKPPSSPKFPTAVRSNSGVALVVVLSILVLLVTVVVAFMVSSRNDLSATTQYVAGQEAQALSDTAVNLVMSQIREATLSGINEQGKGTHAWASQPGALRVWDNGGNFVRLYKLYSAASLKSDSLGFLAGEIPTGWRDQPDTFVDLNEPVPKGEGAALKWHYPILNPAALGVVQGFSSSQVDDPAVDWDTRTSMPVRWLYIGRNGEIRDTVQPDSVGRIAFWTDDETSKVNINTASATKLNPQVAVPADDSYWDMPHTRMRQDYNFGRYPLREDEFQRYPGHPATVDLLTVLGRSNDFDLREVLGLTPRYRWGGSENGRVSFTVAEENLGNRLSGSFRKTDRLFASVDEMVFQPDRSGMDPAFPTPADQTLQEALDMRRFFLTAHSRAPDVNLFGQPRVCLWPITDGAARQTVYDRLIAFCASVGRGAETRRYYFLRSNPLSQTDDWTLFARNRTLMRDYLDTLTRENFPGYGGGGFTTKYDVTSGGVPGEWRQILTQMFDWIRCVNLNETSGSFSSFQSYTTNLDYEASAVNLADVSAPGAGLVLPIRISDAGWDTRGAGRVPVLSEAGFRMIRTKASDAAPDPNGVEIALLPETFSPMAGPMPWMPLQFSLSLTNVGLGFQVEGETVFADGATPPVDSNPAHLLNSGQVFGGIDGFSWILRANDTLSASGNLTSFPFRRQDTTRIPVPEGATSVTIQGGAINLGLSMAGETYQTYTIRFLATSTPIPPVEVAGNRWQKNRSNNRSFLFGNADVAKSVSLRDGDFRITAYLQDVPEAFFAPSVGYLVNGQWGHSFLRLSSTYLPETGAQKGGYLALATYPDRGPKIRADITDLRNAAGRRSEFSAAVWEGDFDTGFGLYPDGSYLGKSDEGWYDRGEDSPNYFDPSQWSRKLGFFSPTKQVPSAVMFGSLPTAVKRTRAAYVSGQFAEGRPWRTLLFCPNPLSGTGHFGFTAPADHLLLDLFHLPVVEPYAISEPLSTAGRINMNSQILPFTDIVRESGLYAVLNSHRVTALAVSQQGVYKSAEATAPYRYRINVAETLWQFRARFAPNDNPSQGDLFRSPSEICSLFLVPNTSTAAAGVAGPTIGANGATWNGTSLSVPSMTEWWRSYELTGNNLRERPYALIYPLLTTKSNTYSVHVWAQSLVQGTTKVTGEYRGSSIIERYVDPADERIGSEIDPDTQSLEPLYRFRVVDTKRFAP